MQLFHAKRLLKLAKYLDDLDKRRFYINQWYIDPDPDDADCGTTACALGHATYIPAFRRAGLCRNNRAHPELRDKTGRAYCSEFNAGRCFFGLADHAEALYLFSPLAYLTWNPGPKAVARRIRSVVRKHNFGELLT